MIAVVGPKHPGAKREIVADFPATLQGMQQARLEVGKCAGCEVMPMDDQQAQQFTNSGA